MCCLPMLLLSHNGLRALEIHAGKRRQRQRCYRNAHKHKTPDTMCFHLAMQATGRGNAASCGRIGGEGGGHSQCALCVYSSSYCCSMCLFYWCCLWGCWLISTSNVDTTGFGPPRGPPVENTHCTLFLTPVICDRVEGFRAMGPALLWFHFCQTDSCIFLTLKWKICNKAFSWRSNFALQTHIRPVDLYVYELIGSNASPLSARQWK